MLSVSSFYLFGFLTQMKIIYFLSLLHYGERQMPYGKLKSTVSTKLQSAEYFFVESVYEIVNVHTRSLRFSCMGRP